MNCWNCGGPLPPDRGRIPRMERMFCSDVCYVAFAITDAEVQAAFQRVLQRGG